MTHQLPPPPPDRAHLQHGPAPAMGPGGAHGPAQPAPGIVARKPGTITGVQVILWIFLALSVLGNLFSVISMVAYFNPFTLVALAFALYSGVQSLAGGVQIARGRRWAWIWTLVSAILGLAFSAVSIVLGIVFIEVAWASLLAGVVLGALYGTLLGLLCSTSARQWILMHRIQRGEVPLPGAGTAAPGGFGAPPAPGRPAARPGAVDAAVAVKALLVALTAWSVIASVVGIVGLGRGDTTFIALTTAMLGSGYALIMAVTGTMILACAAATAFGLRRGSFGARVFTIVWTSFLFLVRGVFLYPMLAAYLGDRGYFPPDQRTAWTVVVVRELAILVLVAAAFVAVLLPNVRAWTPGRPAAPLVVMVPVAQQPHYYGAPQQAPPPQYPPR